MGHPKRLPRGVGRPDQSGQVTPLLCADPAPGEERVCEILWVEQNNREKRNFWRLRCRALGVTYVFEQHLDERVAFTCTGTVRSLECLRALECVKTWYCPGTGKVAYRGIGTTSKEIAEAAKRRQRADRRKRGNQAAG